MEEKTKTILKTAGLVLGGAAVAVVVVKYVIPMFTAKPEDAKDAKPDAPPSATLAELLQAQKEANGYLAKIASNPPPVHMTVNPPAVQAATTPQNVPAGTPAK